MTIIETHAFRHRIDTLLTSEEYRLLQLKLFGQPVAGIVVPDNGGLRKLRWSIASVV